MSQSLVGWVGRVELLPLSLPEMQDGGCLLPTLDCLLLNGSYPAIYQRELAASDWFPRLLGVRDEPSISTHAARGALFETWVVSELIKQRFNACQPADLYFWLDSSGSEIDVVYETPDGLQAVEIKSGSTFAADWLDGLKKWQKLVNQWKFRNRPTAAVQVFPPKQPFVKAC